MPPKVAETGAPTTSLQNFALGLDRLVNRIRNGTLVAEAQLAAVRNGIHQHLRYIIMETVGQGRSNPLINLPPQVDPTLPYNTQPPKMTPGEWRITLEAAIMEATAALRARQTGPENIGAQGEGSPAPPAPVAAPVTSEESPQPVSQPQPIPQAPIPQPASPKVPISDQTSATPAATSSASGAIAAVKAGPSNTSIPSKVVPSNPTPTGSIKASPDVSKAIRFVHSHPQVLKELGSTYLMPVPEIKEIMAGLRADSNFLLEDSERRKRYLYSIEYYKATNTVRLWNQQNAGANQSQGVRPLNAGPVATPASQQTSIPNVGNRNFTLGQPPPPRGASATSQNSQPIQGMPNPNEHPYKTPKPLPEREDVKRKRKFREWMKETAPGMEMELGVHDVLDEVLTKFIVDVAGSGARLAKHRKAEKVDIKDLAFYLDWACAAANMPDKQYDLTVPGFNAPPPKRIHSADLEAGRRLRTVLPRLPRAGRAITDTATTVDTPSAVKAGDDP